jgi:hypothetical protein
MSTGQGRKTKDQVGIDLIPEEIIRKIKAVGKTDILVGIADDNGAATAGPLEETVRTGLAGCFPGREYVIVYSGGHPRNDTAGPAADTTIDTSGPSISDTTGRVFRITGRHNAIHEKKDTLRAVFDIASALDVKACMIVDSGSESVTPEWMELLIRPVLEDGYDYAAPVYCRHKYDGIVTNSIVYPLTRALYGKSVRQPIGGNFALSGKLVLYYLERDIWQSAIDRYGMDIWMSTTAIANDFSVCQSFLGAKTHKPQDAGADLSDMLYRVLGTMFDLMGTYAGVWKKAERSEPLRTFGVCRPAPPGPIRVDVNRIIDRFRLGVHHLADVWKMVLSPELLKALAAAGQMPVERFRLPDDVWAETLYQFALADHRALLHREHLLKSFTPLYLGRVASFILAVEKGDDEEAETIIEALCKNFEARKPALVEKWQ